VRTVRVPASAIAAPLDDEPLVARRAIQGSR
jgi:hypothetical protein